MKPVGFVVFRISASTKVPADIFFEKKPVFVRSKNDYSVFLHSKQRNLLLKKLFTIFLSCMLLVPSFGSFVVYTSFKLNQDEIVKTICVQRKLVFNTCNGRCELQKSIKKYSDNERKMQDSLKDKLEVVYIQNDTEINLTIIPVIETKEKSSILFEKKPIGASNLTFHPPLYFA